jgi:hypothetical protein
MTDSDFLSRLQADIESSLLEKEKQNTDLRKSGTEATANIISVMDTGIRVGDNATMMHFQLEVQPDGEEPFRSESQNAISDATHEKFVPGAKAFVRYDKADRSYVAIDHIAPSAPKGRAVECTACGANQIVQAGQLVCIYCGAPLPK